MDGADVIPGETLLLHDAGVKPILHANRKGRLIPSRLQFRAISFCNFPIDYSVRRTNEFKHRDTVSRPCATSRLYLPHFR